MTQAETAGEAPVEWAERAGLLYGLRSVGTRLLALFKGCPLNCIWCGSPESRRAVPELGFDASRCQLSAECTAACPRGAHTFSDAGHKIAWELCTVCGECVEACDHDALFIVGRHYAAAEVLAAARQAGATELVLGGGEPSAQPEFAAALLRGARAAGLATVIETNAAAPWDVLGPLAALAGRVVAELKLIDEEEHRLLTGHGNRQILANLERLASAPLEISVPLIPGLTDTEENINAIYAFIIQLGLTRLTLQPYDDSAAPRYAWFGRRYALKLPRQDDAQLAELVAYAELLGIEAVVAPAEPQGS
jgi:pyruvate formate lyase activating enzyme